MGHITKAQLMELLEAEYLEGFAPNGCRVKIPVSDLISLVQDEFKENADVFFNGFAKKADSPGGKTSGFWLVSERGQYPNFGGVINANPISAIYLKDGVFTLEPIMAPFNGNPDGTPGVVEFDSLTPEQIEMLRGPRGLPGKDSLPPQFIQAASEQEAIEQSIMNPKNIYYF